MLLKRGISFRLLFFFALFNATSASAQREAEEYNLKAAFIYSFTQYVDWDNSSFPEKNFIIGVIGNSPIVDALNELARSKTVKGNKIIVRQYNKPSDIRFCHVLFISKNCNFPITDVLSRVWLKEVLSISEQEGGAAEGAAFNFMIRNNTLKFEANYKTINAAGLKVSSELLKLAYLVN
jgi:hypothetical protein